MLTKGRTAIEGSSIWEPDDRRAPGRCAVSIPSKQAEDSDRPSDVLELVFPAVFECVGKPALYLVIDLP